MEIKNKLTMTRGKRGEKIMGNNGGKKGFEGTSEGTQIEDSWAQTVAGDGVVESNREKGRTTVTDQQVKNKK